MKKGEKMTNYILKLLTIVLLLSSVAFAKKVALLVGVDDYKGEKHDFGGGSKVDLKKMKILFESWGFHVDHLYNKSSLNLRHRLMDYIVLTENY
jgi:hypothetical protein